MSSLYIGLSAGNVGIGTSGAQLAKTHISHTGTGDIFRVDDEAAETTPFIINQDGNVGIGTTNPSNILTIGKNTTADTIVLIQSKNYAGLQIAGDSVQTTGEPGGAYVEISNDAGTTSGVFGITNRADEDGSGTACIGAATNGVVLGSRGGWPVQFAANGDVKQTILSSGNVGIGTTAPMQKLDVNGTIKANAFQLGALATKQILTVHSSQSVGTVVRTSAADSAFGATITITPISPNSRFMIFARMVGAVQQTGGDDDVRGYLDACVQNSDGTYTRFSPYNDTNLGWTQSGIDSTSYADITALTDTNARYLNNLVVRHYGSVTPDTTAGQVTTLRAEYLQVYAVEYI